MKHVDWTGQIYGKLTFLEYSYSKGNHVYWLCQCDCGNKKIIRADSVSRGVTKSCGCLFRDDLTNQKFNRLLALEYKFIKNSETYWRCICDCGKEVIVAANNLKSGHTKSCGCYKIEKISGKNNYGYRHDLTKEERKEMEGRRTLKPKYERWRKKVFKRDNYTCQCCGQYSGSLVAHHVYSWHSHKKLRRTTSNGIVLCKQCHKNFHKQFTNKNNTRKQLNKFLKEHKSKDNYEI